MSGRLKAGALIATALACSKDLVPAPTDCPGVCQSAGFDHRGEKPIPQARKVARLSRPSPQLAARRLAFPKRTQQGFTLLEAIAAFVLLALFIGILMLSLTTSMRNTVRAEQASLAAQWAQSKLDMVGIGEKLEPGRTSDRFDDDFRWEMTVEEFDPPRDVPLEIPFDPEVMGMNLYLVDLAVYWGNQSNEQSAKFTTLRAYSPDQAVLFNGDPAGLGAGMPGGGFSRPPRPAPGGVRDGG